MLGREFADDPLVLVAACRRAASTSPRSRPCTRPARGAAAASAILLLSEDLDEILALADRIVVMYEGRIVGELDAAPATVEQLGLLMAGGAQAA